MKNLLKIYGTWDNLFFLSKLCFKQLFHFKSFETGIAIFTNLGTLF